MPVDKDQFNENSATVQSHLSMSQSVIQRMANNSASCKGWCIAIVSVILVVIADEGKPDCALVSVIPIVLFLLLDTYYLGLEKRFRMSYNEFIGKLHKQGISASDFYAIIPLGKPVKIFAKALLSFSVWPFYITLLFMVGITWKYIL